MAFSMTNGNCPKYNEILSSITNLQPHTNPLYKARDAISLSRLYADVFKPYLRYVPKSNTWYFYNGIKWSMDVGGMKAEEYAKTFSRALLVYSAETADTEYQRFVVKLGERNKRINMIQDARSFYPINKESFDSQPHYFNCQNCVIDLRTQTPIDHDPDLLLSMVSNVVYDPDARSPEFDSFMDSVMMGDQSKIDYIQEIFGYSMIGENILEEMFIFYGSTTRNGKSTLCDVIEHLFGDYALNAMPETLAQKDKNSRSASGDIARLAGCRLLHIGEPPKRMNLDSALLKSLTGRDVVTARHLNEREFQFIPVFKLIMNTNYPPKISDDTVFSSGRMKVITFDKHYTPEEQDVHLKRKLKRPDNISGILNWCLEGLRRFEMNGEKLIPPQPVIDATEQYRLDSDKMQSFINECLIPTIGVNCSAGEAYDVFKKWCIKNGYGTEHKSNFFSELKHKGLFSDRGTINGKTERNVIEGFILDRTILDEYIPFERNDSISHDDVLIL